METTDGPSRSLMTKAEVQQEALRILNVFVDFCEIHGLDYFLGRGALLGAIRSSTFIPWDDDIDVFMPRPDYERLRKLSLSASDVRLIGPGDDGFPFFWLKAVSTRTTFQEHRLPPIPGYGVFLDIFPLDGSDKLSKYTAVAGYYVRSLHELAYVADGNSVTGVKKRLARRIGRVIPSSSYGPLVSWLATRVEYTGANRVMDNFSARSKADPAISKSALLHPSLCRFEGRLYRTFDNPEKYLLGKYGHDWRIPRKRAVEDHGVAHWTDNGTIE